MYFEGNKLFIEQKPQTEEEISSLFVKEEDAIYALYEQLFDTSNSICRISILDAMKYLVHMRGMSNQIEEMEYMREEDVCVIHQSRMDKEVDRIKKETAEDICGFIEEKFFNKP